MTVPSRALDVSLIPVDLILWGILTLAVIVFTVFSAVLLWHWKQYSTHRFTAVASMATYLGVGFCLLALMALSVVWYTFS